MIYPHTIINPLYSSVPAPFSVNNLPIILTILHFGHNQSTSCQTKTCYSLNSRWFVWKT